MGTDFEIVELDRHLHVEPEKMWKRIRETMSKLSDRVEYVEEAQKNADLIRCTLDYVQGSNRILEITDVLEKTKIQQQTIDMETIACYCMNYGGDLRGENP